MTTIQDLLNDISSNYDVVELIERGTTSGGKIYCYDLWYRRNSIVLYKRFNIYYGGTGNAEWYGNNPISPIPTVTFGAKLDAKINDILNTSSQVKYLAVDSINEPVKKAILIGYKDDGSSVTQIKAYVWEDVSGNLQYKVF